MRLLQIVINGIAYRLLECNRDGGAFYQMYLYFFSQKKACYGLLLNIKIIVHSGVCSTVLSSFRISISAFRIMNLLLLEYCSSALFLSPNNAFNIRLIIGALILALIYHMHMLGLSLYSVCANVHEGLCLFQGYL